LADEALGLIKGDPEIVIDGELLGQRVAVLPTGFALDTIATHGGIEP
jgi:hypothetical protein